MKYVEIKNRLNKNNLTDNIIVGEQVYYSTMAKRIFRHVYIEYPKLIKPILIQAVQDYLLYGVGTDEYENAKKWLFEEDTIDYPLTFDNICDELGLNINRLRYEINCLMDIKRFKNKNRYRYITENDLIILLEKSEIDKPITLI